MREPRRWTRTAIAIPVAVALTLGSVPAAALADDPNQAIKDQTDRVAAQTALEQAKAQRATAETARIQALGLPSFEGKTELGANAGAMEINLLASTALGAAAQAIAEANRTDTVVLLSGDEAVDFGAADAMRLQMESIRRLYELAGIRKPAPVAGGDDLAGGGAPAVIAAVSAVAGLFRSETTISGADAPAVTQQMLVAGVAARLAALHNPAILPSAFAAGVPASSGRSLYALLDQLAVLRLAAATRVAQIDAIAAPTAAQKQELADIAVATTRHDAFLTKVMTADDTGAVPFATAARVAGLLDGGRKILRVYVNKAGGSIVNTKNLATTLGVDPVKISGGVLVSYVRSDPVTGQVLGADVLTCDTALTSIRSVQERRWRDRRPGPIRDSLCRSTL